MIRMNCRRSEWGSTGAARAGLAGLLLVGSASIASAQTRDLPGVPTPPESRSAPGDPPIVVDIDPPPPAAQASTYARRYRISTELAQTILESAVAEGIDPELGFRIVWVESVFRPNAVGPGGSLGLTQLMPSTARAIDRSLRTNAQILEPRTNLRTGFRYLRRLIERYKGDVRLGVLAYNRGETAVDRALRSGRDPENGYSPKVLGTVAADQVYTGSGTLR